MSRRAIILSSFAPVALLALAGTTLAQNTERVSVAAAGGSVTTAATTCKVTPGGRFVVFTTTSALVADDTNGRADVYVRDRNLGTIARVSLPDPSMGGEGNDTVNLTNGSGRVISDDGRYVIFTGYSNNLVANDTNGVEDVFIRDRDADNDGTFDEPGVGNTRTRRVSLSSGEGQGVGPCPNDICDHGSQHGVISANGRYVAWESNYGFTADNTAFMNVYWRDRDADNDGIFDEAGGAPDAAVTKLVSKRIGSQFVGQTGDGFSRHPSISADGRWVTFESVSRFMVFSDSVANQEVFVRDMFADLQNIRITEPTSGGQPDGSSSSPNISANGRYVAFLSSANNLSTSVDENLQNVLLKDRDSDNDGIFDEAGGVEFINCSVGRNPFIIGNPVVTLNSDSFRPSISDDGRYVGFDSTASNFSCSIGCADSNGTSDVFVYDRLQNFTVRASVTKQGNQITGISDTSAISPDARFIGFSSDGNGIDGTVSTAFDNVYVRTLYSTAPNTTCGTATPVFAGSDYVGDTYGSTGTGEVTCGLNAAVSPAVWYSYTATCNGTITMDTIGSSYDTVLSVYDAPCPATAAKQIVCNDDGVGLNFRSTVTFNVAQGQTYIIRLSGYDHDAGYCRLNVGTPLCAPNCIADFNQDGDLNPDDLGDYINCYFGVPPCGQADFNNDGDVNPDDLGDYINAYFAGCP